MSDPFLQVIVLPLAVGIILLVPAALVRNGWAKAGMGIPGILCMGIFIFYGFTCGTHLWASHLELRWRSAQPKNKTQFEALLWGYTIREIMPGQWGMPDLTVQQGQRITRYSLLGEPVDVVYNGDETIAAIYPSFD